MGDERANSMRKLGRWAGRIRAGFLQGLRGDQTLARRESTVEHHHEDAGNKVVLRRTTIEEIEIREPERR